MTVNTGIRWTREEDETWAANFELELVLKYNPQKGLADQALSEVHEMVTETGRSAQDLFDDPRQYAASVAAERIDEAHTSRVDLAGTTAGERFTGGLAMAGFSGVLLSATRWVRNGIWVDVSWATLTGVSGRPTLASAGDTRPLNPSGVNCSKAPSPIAPTVPARRIILSFLVMVIGHLLARTVLAAHRYRRVP